MYRYVVKKPDYKGQEPEYFGMSFFTESWLNVTCPTSRGSQEAQSSMIADEHFGLITTGPLHQRLRKSAR